MGVAEDGKKMKNAEQLMRHTSFRLSGILNALLMTTGRRCRRP